MKKLDRIVQYIDTLGTRWPVPSEPTKHTPSTRPAAGDWPKNVEKGKKNESRDKVVNSLGGAIIKEHWEN